VLITALTGTFNNNGICFWVYTKQRKLRCLLRAQHLFMPKLIPTRPGIADLGKPRIVIVGGGFGGLETAKGLRNVNVQTVLFDKYNHHCFQPLLYQVATSALETSSIVFPFRKHFNKDEDFFFRLGEVNMIKPEENCIETSIAIVTYDYLVIANGAGTNFYGMKDVEENAYAMKSIIDSIKLRNVIIRNFETALLAEDPELVNIWMFIHLISLIGFKNKFFVLLSWRWGYFTYDKSNSKSNRLIIARPQDGVN
jgi:NADH dehydrogenase FAD-containing subunit